MFLYYSWEYIIFKYFFFKSFCSCHRVNADVSAFHREKKGSCLVLQPICLQKWAWIQLHLRFHMDLKITVPLPSYSGVHLLNISMLKLPFWCPTLCLQFWVVNEDPECVQLKWIVFVSLWEAFNCAFPSFLLHMVSVYYYSITDQVKQGQVRQATYQIMS